MDERLAHEIASASSRTDPGSFYAQAGAIGLGTGLILQNVEFPIFDQDADRFAVKSGLVYVLTHECDLDPNNDRLLNDYALICPLISLEDFLGQTTEIEESHLRSFIANLAARNVSRAVYFPPIHEVLPYGGMLYLNALSHTHLSKLEAADVNRVCSVTGPALRVIDAALTQHLLRPKADRLPLMWMQ